MSTPFFNTIEGARRRDAAIARGEDAAHARWKEAAMDAIHACARRLDSFTTDQVVEAIRHYGVESGDHRALGGLMKRAEKHGWIEQTDRTRPSALPQSHRRPKRVWRSRLGETPA